MNLILDKMNILTWLLFVQTCFSIKLSTPAYRLTLKRADVIAVNEETMNFEISMSRINRSTITTNAFTQIKKGFPPYYTVSIRVYEFLSNEYRPFAINMKRSICDFFETEYKLMLYPDFVRIGAHMPKPKCPILKGNYSFENYTPQAKNFPAELPFKDAMIEVKFLNGTAIELHLKIYMYLDRDVIIRERYS